MCFRSGENKGHAESRKPYPAVPDHIEFILVEDSHQNPFNNFTLFNHILTTLQNLLKYCTNSKAVTIT